MGYAPVLVGAYCIAGRILTSRTQAKVFDGLQFSLIARQKINRWKIQINSPVQFIIFFIRNPLRDAVINNAYNNSF